MLPNHSVTSRRSLYIYTTTYTHCGRGARDSATGILGVRVDSPATLTVAVREMLSSNELGYTLHLIRLPQGSTNALDLAHIVS